MSRGTAVETLKRLYAALNAGDRDTALSCLTDDVVFDTLSGVREIGRDRVRWALAERGRSFAETYRDLALMCDEGGRRAAAEFTLRGTYQADAPGLPTASGQSFSVAGGAFFDVEPGGRLSRASFYANAADLVRQLAK